MTNRLLLVKQHLAMPLMNHTMLRIADPARSLEFYERNFGMSLLTKLEVPELGFTNYFLAVDTPGAPHRGKKWFDREGVLELCHNHGSTPENFKANNGNKEPHQGFGHICFSVPDLEGKCAELESSNAKFQKKLQDGRQKNLAFVLDPDGYWIELVSNGGGDLRFNHSMIRVKDKKRALDFYVNKLGMTLIAEKDYPEAKFSLYFLSFDGSTSRIDQEGIIELTWNHGTESKDEFSYHNGNEQPQGFGHFGLAVDDVQTAMDAFEQRGVEIQKRLTDGKMKFIGFVKDPDGYSWEVLPKADFPKNILA